MPPLWGGYETWSCKVNMTNPADSLEHPEWNFDYYFDQPNTRELYVHRAGQGDEVCKKIAADAEECWVLTVDGKAYISNMDTGECCHQHGWMIRDDWLTSCGATYNDTITEVNGEAVDLWQCSGNYLNNYVDTVDGNEPVRFFEHKGDLLKQWDFVRETFKVDEIDESLFEIPSDCPKRC
ncbi:hypothetical protein TrCOL_g12504 [Triparma columacea]|uniref:Uncharacterized protein n=1 Tax=Triparma columacea TaxID=722753 RepID=A0A9W7LFZ2_9STRA|nr:hypothetical protein TrCOL_g12504 [Triparma columacea]